jgi:hypothetical protein
MRYKIKHKLDVSKHVLTTRDKFWHHYGYMMMAEILYCMILGPNYGYYNVKFTTSVGWNMLAIDYDLNDLMIVMSLPRLYTIIRFLLIITPYYNDRAHRVNMMMGCDLNILFAVRCIFYSHPVKFLGLLFMVVVIPLSWALKIFEGPVWYVYDAAKEANINYNYFENCIWNVLVTMTTVGYGDYYPYTNLGRLVIIITAFCGSTLISLMTLITGNSLSLSETEKKVYDFGNRLDSRLDKETSFKEFIGKNFKYTMRLKQLNKYVRENPNNFVQTDTKYINLKKDVHETLYSKIKLKKQSKTNF